LTHLSARFLTLEPNRDEVQAQSVLLTFDLTLCSHTLDLQITTPNARYGFLAASTLRHLEGADLRSWPPALQMQ